MTDTTWTEDPSALPYENAETFDNWFTEWFRDACVPSAQGGFESPYSTSSTGAIVSCRQCGALVLHGGWHPVESLNSHRRWHDSLDILLSRKGE